MIRIAVCDDNEIFLRMLTDKIQMCYSASEIKTFLTGCEFLKSQTGSPFDVIFLDSLSHSIMNKVLFCYTSDGVFYDYTDF